MYFSISTATKIGLADMILVLIPGIFRQGYTYWQPNFTGRRQKPVYLKEHKNNELFERLN